MNGWGKWFLTIIGVMCLLVILLTGVVPMIMSSVGSAELIDAAMYWQQQGYVAYADASGNLIPLSGDNVSDLGTEAASWNDAYIDGQLYAKTGRSATYVVAANDAPDHVKAQADYVADGTADNAEIQAAFDALPAGRDYQYTVKLVGTFNLDYVGAEGVYTYSLLVPSYTIVDMSEAKLYIADGQDASALFVNDGSEHIWIFGGEIDGNKANQTGDSRGIYVRGSSDILIENVYIHDTYLTGIIVRSKNTNSNNIRIINNTVVDIGNDQDAEADGIDVASYDATYATNILIIGNTVDNVGDEGIGLDEGVQDALITNNYIIDTYNAGIAADTHNATLAGMTRVTIIDNRIISCGKGTAQNASMSIDANAGGQVCSDFIIAYNYFYESGQNAVIRVSGRIENIKILNNRLMSVSTTGILIIPDTEGAITKYPTIESISGNVIKRTGNPTGPAIDISAGEDDAASYFSGVTIISGNDFDWRDTDCIKITGITSDHLTGWLIADNKIRHTAGNGKGIYLVAYCDYFTIRGNYITGSFVGGDEVPIVISSTSLYNIVHDNDGRNATNFANSQFRTAQVRNNQGYITENSGTATITSGNTVVQVPHGLSITPDEEKIRLTPLEDPTNTPGVIGVSANATDTYFWFFCENDPGASNLDIGWSYAD